MGHLLLGPLPRTRRWREVVALIESGASSEQVATATIFAAEKAFNKAANDKGVVETVWLLMQLPHAARERDFVAALRGRGVEVTDASSLPEIVSAVSKAIEAKMPNCRGRTDLGELAQTAAVETLTRVIGEKSKRLYDTSEVEIKETFAAHTTVKQFGSLAREFFGRFMNKCLNVFLSRTMPDHVGEGRRFTTLAQQSAFTDALNTHTYEAAKIVEEYSGDWLSKENYESGGHVTREESAKFTSYAMTKLIAELKAGA